MHLQKDANYVYNIHIYNKLKTKQENKTKQKQQQQQNHKKTQSTPEYVNYHSIASHTIYKEKSQNNDDGVTGSSLSVVGSAGSVV